MPSMGEVWGRAEGKGGSGLLETTLLYAAGWRWGCVFFVRVFFCIQMMFLLQ